MDQVNLKNVEKNFLIKKIFRALVLTANCFLARKTAQIAVFASFWNFPNCKLLP